MDGERKGWKGRAEEETLEPPSLLAGGEPSPILAGSADEGEGLRSLERGCVQGASVWRLLEECVRESQC